MLNGLPEKARKFVAGGDTNAFFIVGMQTSMPSELDTPTNVTPLGDAVHAVASTLGRGLNLAMRDAALLERQLKATAALD